VYQGRNDKLVALGELLQATGLEAKDICYVGDDWIDLPVLERAGLSVTVADADSVMKNHVDWVTSRAGGKGAVREICNLIMVATGIDKRALDEILNA
jgi:3-deoxy-D-manno-octulosonate 8-phosphate phosphatase (KDO 8-P phosphatase)